MRTRPKVLALGFMLVLASACVAPPPGPEQATAIAKVAESRATEAAAVEKIAAAKATEAAAGQQIAQLTAEAVASVAITTTATVSPTILITSTIPATSTVVLSPTVQVSLTLTDLLTSPVVTATVAVTATPPVSLTVVATPTVTVTLAVTTTATPTATVEVTATATPTATAVVIPTATPAATPIPTSTPRSVAAGAGWVWPGLPAAGPAGQVSAATPTAAPTPVSFGTAVVTSSQANVRGGPGTTFPVVATTRQGTNLQITGSNEGQTWWQVCCIDDQAGWISQTVARFQGDPATVPVVGPLMPDDLNASWELRWECHGSGCKQEECLGESAASALRVVDDRWLEVTRNSAWPDGCGEAEDWLTMVDRYSGRERQSSASATLFNIWEGANPGTATRSVDLLDRQLTVWCTDTRTQEVEQQDGWTVLYEGQACYDTKAGVLTLMQYVKRWLFSGTVNGQTFDKQYFGDYEVYQQVLTGANAPLSGN